MFDYLLNTFCVYLFLHLYTVTVWTNGTSVLDYDFLRFTRKVTVFITLNGYGSNLTKGDIVCSSTYILFQGRSTFSFRLKIFL